MSDPDRTLADRAARGDRRALMELYERHRSRLFGYLTRSLGNATLAEDVFQDVWIKVMQKIGTYRPGTASFRAWLYRVASNAAVDRLRREAVRSGPELDAPVHDGDERRVDQVASSEPGPDQAGIGRVFARDLTTALDELSAKQKAAVLLRHQQGLSYPEIARALAVREGTAKTLVHRGVLRLRVELSAWAPEESSDDDA
jgi:RNA polymerase sigma-70 factor (ECF subfamily)